MARKKKEQEDEKDYDILIGFIKSFNFTLPEDTTRLSGHPKEGRLYRLLKDPIGWRLHLGRETNQDGLDGLFLGPHAIYNDGALEGEHQRYTFKIEVVTPANYLALPIVESDREQLFDWINKDNKDLWDTLNREQTGESSVIRTGSDLLRLVMMGRQFPEATTPSVEPDYASADKERALEATLTLLTHYPEKSADQLASLFDVMYGRILNTLRS